MPWSDWQDYGNKVSGITPIPADKQYQGFFADGPDLSSDEDVAAELEQARQSIVTYDPTTGSSTTPPPGTLTVSLSRGSSASPLQVGVSQFALKNDDVSPETYINAAINTSAVCYRGTGGASLDPFPPLLDTLEYRVDFDEIPGSGGEFVEYEGTEGTFVGWEDHPFGLAVNAECYDYLLESGRSLVTANSIGVPDFAVKVFAATAPPLASPTLDPVYGYGPGTLIDTITPDLSALDPTSLSGGQILNEAQPATLHLGSVTDPEVALFFQTEYLDTKNFDISDFAMPTRPGADQRFREVKLSCVLAFWPSTGTPGTGLGTLNVVYALPRFRYWIPDDKLRTIGDHFRSVGGADIKSLIPGVGWVKVRRGT